MIHTNTLATTQPVTNEYFWDKINNRGHSQKLETTNNNNNNNRKTKLVMLKIAVFNFECVEWL